MSDIDTAAADSLKALDPERPIREADMAEHANCSTRSLADPYPPRRAYFGQGSRLPSTMNHSMAVCAHHGKIAQTPTMPFEEAENMDLEYVVAKANEMSEKFKATFLATSFSDDG